MSTNCVIFVFLTLIFVFLTVTKTIKTSVNTTLRGMDVLTGLDEAEPLRLAASQCFFFSHASSAIFDFGFHFFLVPTIPPKQLQQ